ncbi:sphingomyelin phosphodiesterase [Chitinimonas koreensis]|uniref:sphingomyelin phosphodiesterase n=1 Tax=Chitinimonas koreensis TaxID=356302 RepID=UPI0003F723AA|nr:sphingomyelin phosphodiesterase [Chitinimonas koreensis]QNM96660.1 sphingomyelin phosphodiesterase [Chitinimonas koreensis]
MHHILRLALLALCLLASRAFAETYVYVTNDTAQTVYLNTVQSGDKQLAEGTHWGRYATSIAPYATAKVLWMNRDQGITNGKTFRFDTTVSQGSGSVVLQQQLTGKLIGSSIVHSAKAADFNEPWRSDRDIHNAATRFNALATTLSYRAQFTGGYDDIYYVVHPQPKQETLAAADEFKVLSWNIWGVVGASQICERWAQVPAFARNYDAIVFSEAFDNGCRDQLRAGLAAEFPYQTQVVDQSGNFEDGGVFIASRWPIAREAQIVYPNCANTDCLSNKGAMYVQILKQGRTYHLAGTHTQAWNGTSERAVRLDQLSQLKRFVDGLAPAATDALLYAGDLNVDYYATPDDYQRMLSILNASKPASLGHRYSYDPVVNALGSDGQEYLDYVLVSNAHKPARSGQNEVMVYRSLAPALWSTRDLSDHFAVAGRFAF